MQINIGDLWVNIEDLIEEPRVNDFVHALINEMGIELLNDIWVEAQSKGAIEYVENVRFEAKDYVYIISIFVFIFISL